MLINQMEKIVEEIYQELIKKFPEYCTCEQCKSDVFCMALNKLPPMYNTTSTGQAYGKLMGVNPQFKVEAMQIVGSAIQQVGDYPRHG
jgi:competence protein ComFB